MPQTPLILASQNIHKCQEFCDLGLQVVPAQPFSCEENAATYLGNSLLKARVVQNTHPGCSILADDSGLEVRALGNRPGIHSARYGLSAERPYISSEEQNSRLLQELTEERDRRAQFVCCLVLLCPDGPIYAAQASLAGEISTEPRSLLPRSFGYDPVFQLAAGSPYAGKTFAELDEGLKQQLSHRFLAWQQLLRLCPDLAKAL